MEQGTNVNTVEVVYNEVNELNETSAIYAYRPRTVTLRRGEEYVTCNEVLFWSDDSEIAQSLFDEWMESALEGDSAYSIYSCV